MLITNIKKIKTNDQNFYNNIINKIYIKSKNLIIIIIKFSFILISWSFNNKYIYNIYKNQDFTFDKT